MSQKKILIVDDSQILLMTLSLKLRVRGYLVQTATDPASALVNVKQDKPDLLILDVNFPNDSMSGFDLMAKLKRMRKAMRPPVLVISASDPGDYQEQCLKAGAIGFFLKPINHEQLLATLRQTLNQTPEEQKVVPLSPEPGSAGNANNANDGPKRILIAEDNVSLGESLQEFLKSEQFSVTRVTDSVAALTQVKANNFDIVLCDMVMPGQAGHEFYRAVQRLKPELCKQFIFMTGHEADPNTDDFIRHTRNLMLWKPFLFGDLLTAIGIVWKKSRSTPPPGVPSLSRVDTATPWPVTSNSK